ncbi:hypothetical protein SCA6_017062 [Theobroma cacao]
MEILIIDACLTDYALVSGTNAADKRKQRLALFLGDLVSPSKVQYKHPFTFDNVKDVGAEEIT